MLPKTKIMLKYCKVERKILVTTKRILITSGQVVPDSEKQKWVEEPCNAPIFGDSEDSVCPSCKRGWEVDTNYPIDTKENRALVPHYFTY